MSKVEDRAQSNDTSIEQDILKNTGNMSFFASMKSSFLKFGKTLSRFIKSAIFRSSSKIAPLPTTNDEQIVNSSLVDSTEHNQKSPDQQNGQETVSTMAGALWLKPLITLASTKKCLVLDLDETLIHSSFNIPIPNADFILELFLSSSVGQTNPDIVYVSKRPGLDQFLETMASYFEIVIFTASLPSYANPVIDRIDPIGKFIHHRLFRHSLVSSSLESVIIVDNCPMSYILQPQNAIAIPSWFSDPYDLYLPILTNELIKFSSLNMSLKYLRVINELIEDLILMRNNFEANTSNASIEEEQTTIEA